MRGARLSAAVSRLGPLLELRLKIRHALGDTAQPFGAGPRAVELPAQRVDLLLKPYNLGAARVECVLELLLEFPERILSVLFCDPMALPLCAQLAVAIGDDSLEPDALRLVLSRDPFDCLKRGLQPIERLTDPTVFGGDPLKLRLTGRPGEFVGLSLLIDNAVQMMQLIVGRAEPALKRLLFQLNLPYL